MYGGTGRTLAACVAAMALPVALAGCQDETPRERTSTARETSAEKAAEPAESRLASAADYDSWEPTYGDVRPATADDVAALQDRIEGLNASSYTARVPAMDLELAYSPEHARVTVGGAWTGGYELHLDPRDAGDEMFDLGSYVVCSLAEDACSEVGPDSEAEGPHMFNNGLDTLIYTAGSIVQTQGGMAELLGRAAPGNVSVAVVDSPSGPLDCVVEGSAQRRERLEGKPVGLVDHLPGMSGAGALATTCIDERGLVVVTLPSFLTPVVPYSSFEEGVPDDYDEYPDPVPYGTTPSPESPESSATTSQTVVNVLVAREDIEAGESLLEVQQTGRLELDAVAREQLVDGAVDSTDDLDGVATRDIYAGEQITQRSFD